MTVLWVVISTPERPWFHEIEVPAGTDLEQAAQALFAEHCSVDWFTHDTMTEAQAALVREATGTAHPGRPLPASPSSLDVNKQPDDPDAHTFQLLQEIGR